jgi:hypothetical protein
VIHNSAVGLSLNKSVDCTENNPELRSKKSRVSQSGEISSSSLKKKERAPSIDSSAVKNHPPSSIFQIFFSVLNKVKC